MSSRSGMFCHTCGKQLPHPNHFAFSDKGDVEVMCDECFDDIGRFYRKGVNVNESRSRRTNKRDEQKI